jgi:hypothetical protein
MSIFVLSCPIPNGRKKCSQATKPYVKMPQVVKLRRLVVDDQAVHVSTLDQLA